jgi:formamidopyrimidine-DNA glycosylase
MPEGPEVCIIANVLYEKCKGKIISHVLVCQDSRYYHEQKDKFKNIVSMEIIEIASKGKKIFFILFSEKKEKIYLVSSLGMEGRWKYEQSVDPETRHLSIAIFLSSGICLNFYDHRHFGHLDIVKDLPKALSQLGPSWLSSVVDGNSSKITIDEFVSLLQNKRLHKKKIMDFLLDQKYTSGVGNYIRAEALYMAKINPYRLINSLLPKEAKLLFDSIMDVVQKSLEANGHTLKSYFTPIGEKGGYVPIIYGKDSDPDGNTIRRDQDSTGRTIHWCPAVQGSDTI